MTESVLATYEFTIWLDSRDMTNGIVFRLRNAGIRDAILDRSCGETKLKFRRRAIDGETAFASAVLSIERAGYAITDFRAGWQ